MKKYVPESIPEFVPEFGLNLDLYSGTNSGMNSGTYFFMSPKWPLRQQENTNTKPEVGKLSSSNMVGHEMLQNGEMTQVRKANQ